MEYVIGVLAIWFIGTLPATYIASRLAPDWDADDEDMNTEDRVIGFVAFWPFVVLKRFTFAAAWLVSRPFAWMYRAIWDKGAGNA